MGVVKRQGIKQSIINYVGVFIGMFNVLLVYPFSLTAEELGAIRFVLESAVVLVPFASLGGQALAIKYFPVFEDKKNFLLFLLVLVAAGAACMIGVWFFLEPLVLRYYEEKTSYATVLHIIPFIVIAQMGGTLLSIYLINFKRIVVPEILSSILIKVTLPIFCLFYFYGKLPFIYVFYLIFAAYAVSAGSMFLYTRYIVGRISMSIDWVPFKRRWKQMAHYAGFSLLNSIGFILVTRIDLIMVASLGSFSQAGIYSIALFVGNVIGLPKKALLGISIGILSEKMHQKAMDEVSLLYQRTASILLFAGMLFLTLIWHNIDYMFDWMPQGEVFKQGKYIVLLIGVVQIVDMVTGLNESIISYSQYYRFNLYAYFSLAGFNILFNLLLIPEYGMIGAGIATLVSTVLFNLVKMLYVYYRFNMWPFSTEALKIGVIGFVAFIAIGQTPTVNLPQDVFVFSLVNVAIKSLLTLAFFVVPIWVWPISDDLKGLLISAVDKILRRQ